MMKSFNVADVFRAMFVSEPWHELRLIWKHSQNPRYKRMVLHARTCAAVVHDRVLNEKTAWSK